MILYPKYFPVAGFTPLPNLMLIRKDCRDNKPLHIHEEVHQRQMVEDGVLKFWFKYLFCPNCRLKYEVEAYRAQIAAGASLDSCAAHLSGMYYLGIDFEQARCLLR